VEEWPQGTDRGWVRPGHGPSPRSAATPEPVRNGREDECSRAMSPTSERTPGGRPGSHGREDAPPTRFRGPDESESGRTAGGDARRLGQRERCGQRGQHGSDRGQLDGRGTAQHDRSRAREGGPAGKAVGFDLAAVVRVGQEVGPHDADERRQHQEGDGRPGSAMETSPHPIRLAWRGSARQEGRSVLPLPGHSCIRSPRARSQPQARTMAQAKSAERRVPSQVGWLSA
jgi:hypothetical protein